MATQPQPPAGGPASEDHRIAVARTKRESMRMRILDATMHVFARISDDAPVIEDVVREAQIARGTFYKHFDSLDEALVAAGAEANDRMIADLLPLYEFLVPPWQRAAVGFRVYMVRAVLDPKWAAFVTRMDAWSRQSLITQYMSRDLLRGCELGQFGIDDVEVAVDFLKGASAGVVHAMRCGVAESDDYMDKAVRMALRALGCAPDLCERAVAFSREHLAEWRSGERSAWTPL